jgi:hypothetical protein|tara:strand:+ start:769 stop:984 length:216 start_codon:yes stop_codon:yes gene_type:complete
MRRKSRRDKDAFYTDLNDPIDIIWLLAVRAKVIDLGYAPEEAACFAFPKPLPRNFRAHEGKLISRPMVGAG